MTTSFDIIDMWFWAFYIGLKITINCKQKKIKLTQTGYVTKLFDQYRMLKAKTAKILIQKTLLILYKKPISFNKNTKYVAKIRFIIYAIVET